MSNPVRQRRSLRTREKEPFYLFNDQEITLKAKFKWKEKYIKKINFTLKNLLEQGNTHSEKYRYKICCVRWCKDTPKCGQNAIVIQLSYYQYDKLPETSSGFIDLKKENRILFGKGKEQLIIFNVDGKDCKTDDQKKCVELYDCELNGATPKTKDGAIVEGI